MDCKYQFAKSGDSPMNAVTKIAVVFALVVAVAAVVVVGGGGVRAVLPLQLHHRTWLGPLRAE